MSRVRTVLGDIAASDLGTVDYHEHLFQATPLLPGEDLDDAAASSREAASMHALGIDAMIDATPTGLGRRPGSVAQISAVIGLTVVATTGAHRDEHYPAAHWLRDLGPDALAQRFTQDILVAMPVCDRDAEVPGAVGPDGRPARAGVLKAGVGYWSISSFETAVLTSIAQAHGVTNAPVMVHLEHGSCAMEVLDILEKDGVAPDAVALAHIDRNPDPVLHTELAARGAYLGYDGAARHARWPDSALIDCLLRAAAAGAAERILLGGDVARRSRYQAYGGMPGLSYLPRRFIPRLRDAGGEAIAEAVLITNPARYLARFPDA